MELLFNLQVLVQRKPYIRTCGRREKRATPLACERKLKHIQHMTKHLTRMQAFSHRIPNEILIQNRAAHQLARALDRELEITRRARLHTSRAASGGAIAIVPPPLRAPLS